MVFGITNRLGWHGPTPEHIWRFWDQYHFAKREMIGFWDAACPVQTSTPDLGATVFRGKEDTVVAIANWTDKPVEGKITIDWQTLGLNADACVVSMPAITDFQDAGTIDPNGPIRLAGKKGRVMVLRPRQGEQN